MVIVLPFPLTVPEIRILQEYRRLGVETLSLEAIGGIKHPAKVDAGAAARALADRGFLTGDAGGQNFGLAEKAREFLSIDVKPEFEGEAPAEPAGG